MKDKLDTQQYHSMLDIFHESVVKYKNKVAYQQLDKQITYNDVDCLSRDLAAYLQTVQQINKGDRVALMCPNMLCFPIALWGIVRTGAVQVNVNPMYTPRELKHQLNDSQVETIIIFSQSLDTLAEIIDETSIKKVITIDLNELTNTTDSAAVAHEKGMKSAVSLKQAMAVGNEQPLNEPKLSHSDLLFLQYTGGTTGLSKGAVLTHGNIVSNILQFREVIQEYVKCGEEVVITAIPMYHIFALTANTLCYFWFGSRNVLITNPRDIDTFIDAWKNNPVTFFTGVNTLFNGLLHTPSFAEVDFSALKLVIGGGAAVQEAVADKWLQVTGTQLNQGYGLSETSPVLTLNNHCSTTGIGIPVPETDISIRDENDKALPQGSSGELCAKGPQIMLGYWNNDAATKEAMTEDGYFKTGDIAMLDDDGYFHIVDRKKDMILVSGFNVYPNEIEAEVAKMPGILESACVGVNDDKTGEAVKLFIVKQDPNLTEQDVIAFCRENLTSYKVPKLICFIDSIPKSSVGKMLRRKLR